MQLPTRKFTKFVLSENGLSQGTPDEVPTEEPLEIRVRGKSIAVIMRTPGHDKDLVAGFLATEGIIQRAGQIIEMEYCQRGEEGASENIMNAFLTSDAVFDEEKNRRNLYASSSCGLCGKATIEAIHQNFPPVESREQIDKAVLFSLSDKLRAAQPMFDKTGSLHGVGLFDFQGNLLVAREDVGRHNAVDKVMGWALLKGRWPLPGHVLFVSGRLSFEITQKALAGGISIIGGVSGPTSLAVEMAQDSGITLFGFSRGGQTNIYSHPHQIRV